MAIDVTKITTNQEIFDLVAEHLLTMPHRSTRKGTWGNPCAYRGEDGLSCAVGRLLTDDECKLPDGTSIDELVNNSVGCLEDQKILPRRLAQHVELLSSLQCVHDLRGNWQNLTGYESADGPAQTTKMIRDLRKVADAYELNETVLDRFTATGASS